MRNGCWRGLVMRTAHSFVLVCAEGGGTGILKQDVYVTCGVAGQRTKQRGGNRELVLRVMLSITFGTYNMVEHLTDLEI